METDGADVIIAVVALVIALVVMTVMDYNDSKKEAK